MPPTLPRGPHRLGSAGLAASALAWLVLLAAAPAALADTAISGNWSGYAVHRPGLGFHRVTGAWRQPGAACRTGHPGYSAFWVGLGGFRLGSDALEQVGTELDCQANGVQLLSAWYELVPAPSRTIRMAVHPADEITASVTAADARVTVSITDRTRHESFKRTLADRKLDISSAEWIAEAPSECWSATNCRTLPLADFGHVEFSRATAETDAGARGSVASPRWTSTRILMGPGTGAFVSAARAARAMPSPLSAGGRIFTVSYAQQGPAASPLRHQRLVQRVGPRAG